MVVRQFLARLPDGLVRRSKPRMPVRGQSAFVRRLLEQALPPNEDASLWRVGLKVEQDAELAIEMAEWNITASDGLAPEVPKAPRA